MIPVGSVLEQIQDAVEATLPLSDLSIEYAEHSIHWFQVSKYLLFFGSIFIVTFVACRAGFGLKTQTATLLGTCACSALHGIICIMGGVEILFYGHFWHDRKLDHVNTELQNQMMRYSLAYLLFDTVFSLSDPLFLAHHVLSVLYLISVLQIQTGATSATFVFFLGEVTSPIFNSFAALKGLYIQFLKHAPICTIETRIYLFTQSFEKSINILGWLECLVLSLHCLQFHSFSCDQ